MHPVDRSYGQMPSAKVPSSVRNWLLLRSDIHKLFDAGYVTVTPDYEFEVRDHIHTAFDDGENY